LDLRLKREERAKHERFVYGVREGHLALVLFGVLEMERKQSSIICVLIQTSKKRRAMKSSSTFLDF
jgi:hypothetical protein